MFLFLVSLVFATELTLVGFQSSHIPETLTWEEWKEVFGKKYLDDAMHDLRAQQYAKNLEFINDHNSQGLSFRVGVNQFADLSIDEFSEMYLQPFNRTRRNRVVKLPQTSLDSVDWRTKNAVTPVKNQGQCGSCWAFSTTGSTEGAVAIASGKLISLSEQQLVDCSTKEHNNGCGGGLMDYGFKYIMDNQGIDTEDDYPYKAKDGICSKEKAAHHVSTIKSFQDVEQKNADQFRSALSKGPVSIAIEADQRAFQLYKSGIFDSACGTKLDHGVLAVGYTSDYFIVKNSWGATWGMDGYIQMTAKPTARGGGSSGQCGMLMQPSYPIAGDAPGPTPPPGPTPTPGDSYEDPYTTSCSANEVNITISGVSGAICSPSCTSTCPEAPSGFTANAQCALQDKSSGSKYCALICSPSSADACDPSASATCKSIQGVGICTYDQSGPGPTPPPGPSSGPYEKPPCGEGEIPVKITGVDGSFCTQKCSLFKPCPQNSAINGQAECALKDSTSDSKYCAVICQPSESSACNPSDGMTCKSIQGTGICTYDSTVHAKYTALMLGIGL